VSKELGTGLYQYFIKVIPTDYKGRDGASSCSTRHDWPSHSPSRPPPPPHPPTTGKVIRTNRISVSERFKPLHKDGEARLAGDSHAHNDHTSVLPGALCGVGGGGS
jgi:hypothetical protein